MCVCVCVCVCAPRTPHRGLSDTSALEISSGGGSGLNSLPVRIRTGVRTLRSPVVNQQHPHQSTGCLKGTVHPEMKILSSFTHPVVHVFVLLNTQADILKNVENREVLGHY